MIEDSSKMKTKEYIIKYKLDRGGVNSFNHNEFIQDLTIDFMTLLEVGNSTRSIKGFENAVRAIKMKWDAINNKTVGQLPEKLWNYFYASIVAKMKWELFPDILRQRKEERERRARIKEEYRQSEDEYYDRLFRSFFNFEFLKNLFTSTPNSTSHFQKLGLESDASAEDVKKAYREKSMLFHPDKGGTSDTFIELTEAKNKCLFHLLNNDRHEN